ncbi:MAG TPA: hypothetical protein VFA01_03305 [Candidatus Dormibacteraeota bacterium]|nr:hypothetical protein [Candidatus Dormibacteraeota bacterium]
MLTARLLAIAALAGLLLAGVIVTTREPDDAAAIAALLLGVGIVAFALASATFYYVPRLRSRRRRPPALVALRRGAIVGVGVMALGSLRAADALSAATAAFLLAGLAALEGVLSARS